MRTAGSRRKSLGRIAAALGLAVVLSCGRSPEPTQTDRKILFVGIDAMDWDVARPMMEEGKLPHLAGLVKNGTSGDILTLIPLTRSPIIWTTIGTGKEPNQHGVGGFVEEADGLDVPVTRNVRQAKAVWNILGAAGLDVGVVGWWVTWPAEAVRGVMVSDYLQYNFSDTDRYEGQTYPESLYTEIQGMVLTPDRITDDVLAPFVEGDVAELARGEYAQGIEALRWIVAADLTFARVGLHLYRTRRAPFFTVYLRGLDSTCHKFWHEFKAPEPTGSPFRNTVPHYYEFADSLLGLFLALADEETTVLVCSDHGFRGARTQWDGTPALGVRMHREYGSIMMAGPGIRKGAVVRNATVLDVTPTILYFFGLPVAADMRGVVVRDFFTPTFLADHPQLSINTYETSRPAARPEPIQSPVDDELVRRLKALGYIQ